MKSETERAQEARANHSSFGSTAPQMQRKMDRPYEAMAFQQHLGWSRPHTHTAVPREETRS